MKALRRSMKGEKDASRIPHVSISQKSAVAIVPPKMVIRALYDYASQSKQELSFSKGDFFHVIGRENDEDWFEACNPASDARGLVPVKYFQRLGKTERDSGQSNKSTTSAKAPEHDSGYSESIGASSEPQRFSKSMMKGSGALVYGVVMFDFVAERPDELDAKAGEAIIVIAQSNPEWFVAKPIGRLGGPGLIPVSFIEIRDMASGKPVADAYEAVQRAGVPKVEEWKKMAANYKNSSISLGKFETPATKQQNLQQSMDRLSLQQQQRQSQQRLPNMGMDGAQEGQGMRQTDPLQDFRDPELEEMHESAAQYPLRLQLQNYTRNFPYPSRHCKTADILNFETKDGTQDPAFVIDVLYEDGSTWRLWRVYDNFFKFQILLKAEFPLEAGDEDRQRILPYMPGPVKPGTSVDEKLNISRMENLDRYVKQLLHEMPEHISRSLLVTAFFSPQNRYDTAVDGSMQNGYQPGSSRSSDNIEDDQQRASREAMNGNGYGGLSAAPPRQYQQGGAAAYAAGGPNPYNNARQTSSLSQPSNNSLQDGSAQQPAPSAMKVKIYYGDDLFAIRVPTDIHFQQLFDKICDRLKIAESADIIMRYKDEPSSQELDLSNNEDLDAALARNDKLIVYVDVAS